MHFFSRWKGHSLPYLQSGVSRRRAAVAGAVQAPGVVAEMPEPGARCAMRGEGRSSIVVRYVCPQAHGEAGNALTQPMSGPSKAAEVLQPQQLPRPNAGKIKRGPG